MRKFLWDDSAAKFGSASLVQTSSLPSPLPLALSLSPPHNSRACTSVGRSEEAAERSKTALTLSLSLSFSPPPPPGPEESPYEGGKFYVSHFHFPCTTLKL